MAETFGAVRQRRDDYFFMYGRRDDPISNLDETISGYLDIFRHGAVAASKKLHTDRRTKRSKRPTVVFT